MDEQRQDGQLEPIYNSSVPIQDVALKTSREQWTIETGGGRKSMLVACHNDDDHDNMCMCKDRYHHHHVVLLARISQTLSRHCSLSFIASGRTSGLHPVSTHSYCMYVQAGRPAFARPYVGFHRSTSLMSSSLLLKLCPACFVRLTWIVFVMGGRLPYSWCFAGCCRQDLFNIALKCHLSLNIVCVRSQ